jgi:hypothetical protein
MGDVDNLDLPIALRKPKRNRILTERFRDALPQPVPNSPYVLGIYLDRV